MTGQEIIDYIQNNKLENEYVLDCELKFDVRLKYGSRLGYELNDFSDNMVDHYDFTEDGPRLIEKVTLEEALKIREEMKENKTMETIKVTDMSDRLDAESKYCIKISGEELRSVKKKEVILDASDLTIDQLGVIAGFLDAVFDDAHIDKLTGVSIVKSENVKEMNK